MGVQDKIFSCSGAQKPRYDENKIFILAVKPFIYIFLNTPYAAHFKSNGGDGIQILKMECIGRLTRNLRLLELDLR
jgi:hypothetical protein